MRNKINVCLNHCQTKKYGLDSVSYRGAQLWNLLTNDMKECKDLDIFKTCVRIQWPVNLSTESEQYFMLPIFYVSNISFGLTFFLLEI